MRRGLVSPSVNMSRPLQGASPAQCSRAHHTSVSKSSSDQANGKNFHQASRTIHANRHEGYPPAACVRDWLCAYRKTRALRSLSLWGMKSRLILSLEGEACAQILLSTHTYFS